MAKKTPKKPDPEAGGLDFERIEFQAPIGFTARIDEARKRRGLSRSAYVRQAVLLLVEEDLKK